MLYIEGTDDLSPLENRSRWVATSPENARMNSLRPGSDIEARTAIPSTPWASTYPTFSSRTGTKSSWTDVTRQRVAEEHARYIISGGPYDGPEAEDALVPASPTYGRVRKPKFDSAQRSFLRDSYTSPP